jgi:hypothetical protein
MIAAIITDSLNEYVLSTVLELVESNRRIRIYGIKQRKTNIVHPIPFKIVKQPYLISKSNNKDRVNGLSATNFVDGFPANVLGKGEHSNSKCRN